MALERKLSLELPSNLPHQPLEWFLKNYPNTSLLIASSLPNVWRAPSSSFLLRRRQIQNPDPKKNFLLGLLITQSLPALYSLSTIADSSDPLLDPLARSSAKLSWPCNRGNREQRRRKRAQRPQCKSLSFLVHLRAAISAYVEVNDVSCAQGLFEEMDIVSWNAVIVGFIRSGDVAKAREAFERMSDKNVVS